MALIASLAILASTHQPTGDVCGHHHHLEGAVGHIVEAAWHDYDALIQDDAPKTKAQKDAEQHQKDVDADRALGQEYSQEVEKELELSENEEAIQKVQSIGAEIAELANDHSVVVSWGDSRLSQFDYQFKVVKGDDVNAFSLPGGFIYVYEGLVDFAESDDEIAGVMAHEVAHAAFRHLAVLRREQSRFDLVNIPLLIAAAMTRDENALKALVAANLATQGMVSGWSVKAENSADYGAVQYLVKSRYNPVGMLTFMERLAFRDKFSPRINWGIYQTHPPSEERARSLKRSLAEFKVPISRSAVTTSLSAKSERNDDGSYTLSFGKEKLLVMRGESAKTRAANAVIALNKFMDTSPKLFELSTNGHTLMGANVHLFSVEANDGEGGRDVALEEANKALRKAVYELQFRLWQ